MSAKPMDLFTACVGVNKPANEASFPPERRKRVRTNVHWPVLLFRQEVAEAIESATVNLSSSGFYCLVQRPFTVGEVLVCSLKVPTHHANGNHRERNLACTISILRIDARGDGLYGIACRIEDYQFA
jgi:hypothetical protein